MSQLPEVILKPRKEESLMRKHPWVFSGAIRTVDPVARDGDLVKVLANKGRVLGYGHFSKGSSIAIRMLTFEEVEPDASWWNDRIHEAVQVRRDLGLIGLAQQNICRLVHAEGDGLSGLIIDWYDRVAVIQTHSNGMHRSLDFIVKALKEALKDQIHGVYNKSAKVLRKQGVEGIVDDWLIGAPPEDWNPIENGKQFIIDLDAGQKTGFFIDQRDNRSLLQTLSVGKKVLNIFSYTGGFTLAALKGGAIEAVSLDSSDRALEIADLCMSKNKFAHLHRCISADAMEYLKEGVGDFDIVVLDPPAFAKSVSARHQAVQGYKRINQRALQSMKPGALLFTFSCSQAVDDKLFHHTIISAAIQVNRTVRILYRLHQPADHPVSAFHPEGAYLKGLVLRVD